MNLLHLRHANRLAFAASLLGFLVLCACAVYWATVLLAPRSPIAPVEVVADPRANIDVRGAASLFGVSASNAATEPIVSDIQVLGLAASRTRAAAILALDGKPPKAFGEGDMLSHGIKLVQVSEERIVIERNGTRQELAVPARPSLSILSQGGSRTRDPNLIVPVSVSPAPPTQTSPAPMSSAPTSPAQTNAAQFVPNAPPPSASMPPGPPLGQPNPLDRGMPDASAQAEDSDAAPAQ